MILDPKSTKFAIALWIAALDEWWKISLHFYWFQCLGFSQQKADTARPTFAVISLTLVNWNLWIMRDPQPGMLAGSGFGMNFISSSCTVASCWIISEAVQGFQTKQDWEFAFFVDLQEQEKNYVTRTNSFWLPAGSYSSLHVGQIQN